MWAGIMSFNPTVGWEYEFPHHVKLKKIYGRQSHANFL